MTAKAPKEKKNSKSGITACVKRANLWKEYDILNADVTISNGNGKLGSVANVSLPPIVTCKNCSGCKGFCYAVRSFNRMGDYNNAWTKNLAIYKKDSVKYFDDIKKACYTVRFFRWHVSGDIVDFEYFCNMVEIANACSWCEFLAFTKNYEVVNEYIKLFGDLPKNLHVLFSAAPAVDMENPYSLPECHIEFENKELNTFKGCNGTVYHCSGNCEECIANGCGCFDLKKGDVTIINQH